MSLAEPGDWLWPEWSHHPQVGSLVTTRLGRGSPPPWQGFNLGLNCGDEAARVARAREHVAAVLGCDLAWLTQVHGTRIVEAHAQAVPEEADAVWTRRSGLACAVLTADCLPVLMARQDGEAVIAVHAGWRGLQAGILEQAAQRLAPAGEPLDIWVGPGICRHCYQVGEDVFRAFVTDDPEAETGFDDDGPGHWRCDLPALAALRLGRIGQPVVQQSGLCTVCDNDRFYSHRHEARTGRFATLIWLKESC